MTTEATIYATWSLSLDCECPACKEDVDLLRADFWDGRESMQACEHNTEASRDVEVLCPECGHEFKVDLEY